MARHVVCPLDELPPGSRRIVEVAGRSIGVFNVEGELFALLNRCPHQGGPLCEGFRMGALTADEPGAYDHRPEIELIRCPWHGWEFDVRTGQSWFDPQRTRVRSYPVAVQHVPEGEPEPVSGLIKGPYEAETYPVTVENAYVVVEVGSSARGAG